VFPTYQIPGPSVALFRNKVRAVTQRRETRTSPRDDTLFSNSDHKRSGHVHRTTEEPRNPFGPSVQSSRHDPSERCLKRTRKTITAPRLHYATRLPPVHERRRWIWKGNCKAVHDKGNLGFQNGRRGAQGPAGALKGSCVRTWKPLVTLVQLGFVTIDTLHQHSSSTAVCPGNFLPQSSLCQRRHPSGDIFEAAMLTDF
jgi:hypothetical protein